MVNLFLIGAPKAGTTTVYQYFKNHEEIFVPDVKEPGYFSRSNLTSWYKKRKAGDFMLNYDAYLNLFRNRYKYNADCSTSYLRIPQSLDEIHDEFPKSKIIILLRNPYELVVSWHYQKVREGQEINYNFKEAWMANTFGTEIDKQNVFRTDALDYKKVGKIGSQLEYVLELFSNERVLVLNYNELANPEKLLIKIASFLSVKPFKLVDIKANTNQPVAPKFIRSLKRKNNILDQVISAGKRYIPNKLKKNIYKNYYKPQENTDFLKGTGYFDDEILKIKKLTGIELD